MIVSITSKEEKQMSDCPVYLDESKSFEERARDLVSRMTIEEKVSQMLFNAPAIPRLGIPAYNWWNEALHGVARAGTATVFPQAIGMAATFDEDLIKRVAEVISDEARAKHHEYSRKNDRGIYKGLTFWSPNVNIFRDPRWGRGHETYGEDPYLTSRLGVAFVKGLQGDHPKYLKVAACAKHFAVHSGPEAERHSFNAEASPKDLRETYLPAFEACVKEAKVESVMGAYNRTNGEPCCGSKTLLMDILRGEWGFEGHVTSDCWAVRDFHLHHKVTATAPESAALAVKNGCDLNCGNTYGNLLIALEEGLITEEDIDRSVTRLMMTRMKLGMFDKEENVPYTKIPYEVNDCQEHRNLAREVAERSITLLKNDGILPLDLDKINSVAVIGPNADSRKALMGNYYGTASKYVTVLEGIRDILGKDKRVFYSVGSALADQFSEGLSRMLGEGPDRLSEAVSCAEKADVTILCLGLDESLEGEEGDTGNEYFSGDKADLSLPKCQVQLLEAILATGKPVIVVVLAGSALDLRLADEKANAVLQAWYPGEEGGHAVASIIFGRSNPCGRLPVTFYYGAEDLPDFRDYSMKGRTYKYMETEALYPFGFGLSYTSFDYSNLSLSADRIKAGESFECSVTIRNTGKYDGYEVAQLYLKDMEAGAVVPRWQLNGIRCVFLKAGEEKTVSFKLTPRQMALVDDEGNIVLEPGKFRVYVGGSQPDARSLSLTGKEVLNADFEVTGEPMKF